LPSGPPRRARRKRPRRDRSEDRPRERRPSSYARPALTRDEVEPKARATHDLLRILGKRDPWFEPAYLKEVTQDAFELFQECWEDRDFTRLRECLTAECHERFLDRYGDPEKRAILPRWHQAELERLQLVRFSSHGTKEQNTFTVLVTGRDEDSLQEFWTFQRRPQGWQLARIQSANATAALTDPNDLPTDLARQLEADPAAADVLRYVRRAPSDL
jgi:predicted lipid-binding transport protein (Tim44 family)